MVTEAIATEPPAADSTATETEAAMESPATETPATETTAEKAPAEKQTASRSRTRKATAGKASTDRTKASKSRTSRATAGKTGESKARASKASTGKARASKTSTGKARAGKTERKPESYLVRTNEIVFDADDDAIDEKYDFYVLTKHKAGPDDVPYIKSVRLLDLGKDCPAIASLLHGIKSEGLNGANLHVMMHTAPGTRKLLNDAVKDGEEGDSITTDPCTAGMLGDNVLSMLLLLGLPNAEEVTHNNLTGQFFVYEPDTVEDGAEQIATTRVYIAKNMAIELPVCTFTLASKLTKSDWGDTNPNDSPSYIISDNVLATLRRPTSADTYDKDEDVYKRRQHKSCKNTKTFMHFDSLDQFYASKMGILAQVVEEFNRQYSGLAHIRFNEFYIPGDCVTPHMMLDQEEINAKRKQLLSNYRVHVIMPDDDDLSHQLFKVVQEMLSEFGIPVDELKGGPIPGDMNIVIIHNEDYYKEEGRPKDPYQTYADRAVQHITIEDFKPYKTPARFRKTIKPSKVKVVDITKDKNRKGMRPLISKIVNELVIRQDIIEGRISAFDWASRNYPGDWKFAIPAGKKSRQGAADTASKAYGEKQKQKLDMCLMITVHPDGSPEIELYDSWDDIFHGKVINENNPDKGLTFEAAVVRYDGAVNVIYRTNTYPIPDIEGIMEYIDKGPGIGEDQPVPEGKVLLRRKVHKERLIGPLLGFRAYERDGSGYYYIGEDAQAANSDMAHAAVIRKVESVDGAPVFLNEMKPFMQVTFIRENRYTVLPFPLKYLRLYAEMHELLVSDEEPSQDESK